MKKNYGRSHPRATHLILLCLALAWTLVSCRQIQADRHITRTGFFFNTLVEIRIYDPDADEALLDECMELCTEYENLFSAHIEGTDIERINAAYGEAVEVDPRTALLIAQTIPYSELTSGRFDVTIGSVTALWNFTGDPAGPAPTERELEHVLSHVGYDKLAFFCNGEEISYADVIAMLAPSDTSDPKAAHIPEKDAASGYGKTFAVQLKDRTAQIDLGAVAKGYIADRIKEHLLASGVQNALLNLGGNVLLVGGKEDGSQFVVGIQDPAAAPGTYSHAAALYDRSVVTSGTYERYFDEDGVRYHHILDALTGSPMRNGLAGVTVVTTTSFEGDALSTVCFLLGLKEGLELIETMDDVEALFIMENGETQMTDGFPLHE